MPYPKYGKESVQFGFDPVLSSGSSYLGAAVMAVTGASFLLGSLIPMAFYLVIHLEYGLEDWLLLFGPSFAPGGRANKLLV